MSNEVTPNDTQLKLYTILIDQLQKYTTILWQFPTALLAANAFVLDKFIAKPWFLLILAAIDGTLIYALHRLVIQQRAIITATKAAELILADTIYQTFIPKFHTTRLRAPFLIVWWALTVMLAIFALFQICRQGTIGA